MNNLFRILQIVVPLALAYLEHRTKIKKESAPAPPPAAAPAASSGAAAE